MPSLIRRALAVIVFASALLTAPSQAIPGQPGTLDTSWGALSPIGSGKIITPIGSSTDAANAIALQPDGKVLLAGTCVNGTNEDFCAARYYPDGTLDTTWNGTGKVLTPIGSSFDVATAIALQSDGKVLLAGYCYNGTNYNFCAARYNANGTLDSGWGSAGKVITISGGDEYALAIALQPDGKVLLAGSCGVSPNLDFCAARYNANGTLDTTWNSSGKVTTPIGLGADIAYAVALQPDGRVLLAGYCRGPVSDEFASDDFCVARYNANGTLDTTWNSTGKVITFVDIEDRATAIALQPDGKVLLAGYCSNGANFNFCAVRYNANGTLDATWNGTGKVITAVVGAREVTATTLQPDGKVLLAGSCSNGTNNDFCAARYNANGTLDSTWGSAGKVITPIGTGADRATAIALQSDGKVLLAGTCANGTNSDFCAARYDGGPFLFSCRPDLDGDGAFLATTDALIYTRVALGITGTAVVNGITFPVGATRNTWPLIREYLVTQCGMSLPL
jgi:uncharacterized delta-60 repeat protein